MALRLVLATALPVLLAAQPPCAPDAAPVYPAVDAPPAVGVSHDVAWSPPSCASWPDAKSATVVTAAARFRAAGADVLRARIAAVSQLSGLLYWSTTSQRWQPMILSANALGGHDPSPASLAAGFTLDLQQEDNLFGKASYRLRVLVSTPGRIVIATENTTPLRLLGMPVFAAGEVQSISFLDRESTDVWRYYNVSRTGKAAAMLPGHDASLINRAVAMFRYLAAIPAEREPPAAR
jgi:hypothetical protein